MARVSHPRNAAGAARRKAQRFETLGLIIILILIVALTITRSWHYINWSAR